MDAQDLTALVGDRYVIAHRLGDDATGGVFAARDRVLDREVVLKVIRGAEHDPDVARRVREAHAMARLSHPNVIQVFDVVVAADGSACVAMELASGVTLDRWLRERSPDPATIVDAFVAAGRGVAAARGAGLAPRAFRPENVIVGDDGRVRVLDASTDPDSFREAFAAALGRPIPTFATIDDLLAALQPAATPRRGRAVWLVGFAVAIVVGAAAVSTRRAPAVAPPPVGFRCGPWLQTYAVTDDGDARGVRCVLFARDRDGAPRIAWYGEGVRDGAPYRQLGEGRLGGAGTVTAMRGNGEGPGERDRDLVRLDAAVSGPRPPRIAVAGERNETWIRIVGPHTGYTTVLTDPIRTCGPQLTSYRGFRTVEGFAGSSIRCLMPGGRTWLGTGTWSAQLHLHIATSSFEDGAWAPIAADLCNDRDAACGEARHGDLTLTARSFAGIGDGFELSGLWPEVWFPSRRRDAIRIHAIRIADAAADRPPVAVADIERGVRRANELLGPAGFEVLFVADETGPDVATVTDDSAERHARRIRVAQPSTAIVVFRRGASGGCSGSSPHRRIELSAVDDAIPGCATPWDDRLAHALADHLGVAMVPR